MREEWAPIEGFPGYSVSTYGHIRTDKSGRILATFENQYGVVRVGLMKDGIQRHRSVPLLVALTFLYEGLGPFDTPINLDGDRYNNRIDNLAWRPRWFAVKYNQQFRHPYDHPITVPVMDVVTREISPNSFEASRRYGLLESDLVLSVLNRTVVWPTYQQFAVLED